MLLENDDTAKDTILVLSSEYIHVHSCLAYPALNNPVVLRSTSFVWVLSCIMYNKVCC